MGRKHQQRGRASRPVLVALSGLIVFACLGVTDAAAKAMHRLTPAQVSNVYCPSSEHALFRALTTVEANVQIGVNISRYRALLTTAQVAYNQDPARGESVECLNAVGVPDEKALNDYIRALNSWSQCLAKSLTSNCLSSGSVADRFEQRQWADASAQLNRVSDALG